MYSALGATNPKGDYMDRDGQILPDKSFFKKVEGKVIRIISRGIYGNGYCKFDSKDIAKQIFETALQGFSIESNATKPDSDTVFYRLKNSELSEAKIISLLYMSRPQSREQIIVLLDGHDDMYYGKRKDRHNRKVRVVGTQPKQGSHYAFKYLTAKKLHGEVVYRYPLFCNNMTEDSIRIIEELRGHYTILFVIGDGAFPSSLFLNYLRSINMHFVFRFTSTTTLRKAKMFYNKLITYTTTYKSPWGKHKGCIPVTFYICKYRGAKKKDGKRKDFYIISDQKLGPRKLRRFLKDRWDIETGFREIEKLTIFTTTRDYLLRFFFHVVACIIYNFWVQIKKQFPLRLHDVVLSILRLDPLCIFKILEKRSRYFALSYKKPP